LLFGCGLTDFAGSGVVHMTGGVAAFWACFFLGERRDKNPELPGYAFVFQCLGTLILWFGWFGFNGVSTLYIVGYGQVAAKVMVCTTLSASAGAVANLYLNALWDKFAVGTDEHLTVRLGNATNGVLAGLVGITAACAVVEPYAALIIGAGTAPVYMLTSKLLARVPCFGADGNFGTGCVDDVIDAIPVHGFCGIYGVLAAGLFATPHNYGMAYYSARADECAGIFYGGSGAMLSAQLVFILANLCWTSACSIVVFGGLKGVGLLRVAADVEDDGMDVSEHGAAGVRPGEAAKELLKNKGGSGFSLREVEINELPAASGDKTKKGGAPVKDGSIPGSAT
jgi:Amt family ammonium transporter